MLKLKKNKINRESHEVLHKGLSTDCISDGVFEDIQEAEREAVVSSRNNYKAKIIDLNTGKIVSRYKDTFKVNSNNEARTDWNKINKIRERIYNRITSEPFAFIKPNYVTDLNDYIGIVGKNLRVYDSILKSVSDDLNNDNTIVFRIAVMDRNLRDDEKENHPELKYANKFKILKSDQPFNLELSKTRNDLFGVDYYLIVDGRKVYIVKTNENSSRFKKIYEFNI